MKNKFLEFKRDIEIYWHCEVRDAEVGIDLLRALRNPLHPISETEFTNFLVDAILNKTISVQDYEHLTGLDFESAGEVAEDLRDLWMLTFGSMDIKPIA